MKNISFVNIGRLSCIAILLAIIVFYSFHFIGSAQTQTGDITIQINVGEEDDDGGSGGGPRPFLPPPDSGGGGDPDPNAEPPELCGDGDVTASEQCDDGNFVNGDGCSDICEFENLQSNVVQPDPDLINAETIDLDVDIFDPRSNFQHILIFFSQNGAPFEQLPGEFTSLPITMDGLTDGIYEVFSVAVDDTDSQEAQPATADATFTVDLVPTIDVLAYPEKRIPLTGNWATNGRLRFYSQGDQLHSDEYLIPTGDEGYGIVDHFVNDGTYDIAFKGRSHLSKFIRGVDVQNNADISLDYTFNDTERILAGDVQHQKDDFVNSLDISATVLVLYQADIDADLNKDGIVNSLDLSIEAINLFKRGEAP
jgi:cysteine-rich repeat protein